MTVEDAIALVETLLDRKRLTRVQEIVFRQSWQGKTYLEIASDCKYDAGYLKDVGSDLWRSLSKALNEKVTKNNLHSVIEQIHDRKVQVRSIKNITDSLRTTTYIDWSEAIDVSYFDGRSVEIEQLSQCLSTIEQTGGRSIAFSPDGKWLAIIKQDQTTIAPWDIEHQQTTHTLCGHTHTI